MQSVRPCSRYDGGGSFQTRKQGLSLGAAQKIPGLDFRHKESPTVDPWRSNADDRWKVPTRLEDGRSLCRWGSQVELNVQFIGSRALASTDGTKPGHENCESNQEKERNHETRDPTHSAHALGSAHGSDVVRCRPSVCLTHRSRISRRQRPSPTGIEVSGLASQSWPIPRLSPSSRDTGRGRHRPPSGRVAGLAIRSGRLDRAPALWHSGSDAIAWAHAESNPTRVRAHLQQPSRVFREGSWRWRESNPRPPASQWVFSERSRCWIVGTTTATGGSGGPYPTEFSLAARRRNRSGESRLMSPGPGPQD